MEIIYPDCLLYYAMEDFYAPDDDDEDPRDEYDPDMEHENIKQ